MQFDWDVANTEHIARHDVLPSEAVEVFYSGPQVSEPQLVKGEERTRIIGRTAKGRVLEVVFTIRNDQVRVVIAFQANESARRRYERS